ncbi:interferon-related developmental regulator 1 [Podospora aff. communis PSN243]|uniref:Interferon-related developmental regulator 1 n=1 Tax=Podospora aff. communis PSN243 TaxID=3040156 RepID=A0AAV9GZY4_9PEZI|nr:interferon-related developmental regulator 1 [Podospora aff. communis PSN243]
MRDLRKKALLESQKTVSRKARARPESTRTSANHSPDVSPGNSRAGSRANSRPNSRPGSRYASEDEGASDSEYDVMTMSTNSASDDALDDDPSNTWAERLQARIGELQDRKRNAESREATLAAYLHLVRHHYAENLIGRLSSDIITALLRSVREGQGEQERVLALKALMVTLLTSPSEKSSGALLSTLKSLCQEAEEEKVKVQAIYALMMTITHGGAGDAAGEEVLDFLLEIIESDGESVEASDNGAVVTAALRAWGFVASFLDDMAERGEHVMDAFIDQLDSSDPEVQSGAGTNIASLFEAAREDAEETGESNKMQHHTYRIMSRMSEIVKDSSKSISKKGRKQLRLNFTSIVTSLERGVGPGYSTAGRGYNPHVGGAKLRVQDGFEEFGYQETLRVHNQVVLIDSWLLHVRVEVLKMLLGGGLPTHYLENPVVRDMLETAEVNYVLTGTDRK